MISVEFSRAPYFLITPQNQATLLRKQISKETTEMCVHWYFTKLFSESSYHFFSNPKGHNLDELRVSFKDIYL